MLLHKSPNGLLDLYKLRTLGRAPGEFGETVVPTVDTRDFYASNVLIPASSTPTAGALAPELIETLALTAGVGIRSLGARLLIGAAAATNVSIAWGVVFQNIFCVLGSQFFAAIPAGNVVYVGGGPYPFVMQPGSILQIVASGTAAGADHTLSLNGILENYASAG